MHVDFLIERFRQSADEPAIVWRDTVTQYGWLADEIERVGQLLAQRGVPRGAVVGVEADFSPRAVALLLALIEHGAIIVPLTSSVEDKKPEFRAIAEVEA